MDPITYTLRADGQSASSYYYDVRRFTDEVLRRADSFLVPAATNFREFVSTFNLEPVRSVEEYVFELLDMGILWRRYGATAMAVRRIPYRALGNLAEWRKKHQRLKPCVDLLRGILATVLLLPPPRKDVLRVPTIAEVGRLLHWLEATGDLREDALRFIRWYAYWSTLSETEARQQLTASVDFAEWFDAASTDALGMYTQGVGRFVRERSSFYRWREDRITCTKGRAEYHLSMVGAEIMNRAFREDFLATDRRAVLVPGCMRAKPEGECTAIRTKEGLLCSGCTASCNVNRMREMGERRGFRVVIVPHASDVSYWAPREGRPREGVVGVACLAALLAGGWELKRYEIPAQCVVLNECGCPKHWSGDGTPTELDMRELKRVVGLPEGRSMIDDRRQFPPPKQPAY